MGDSRREYTRFLGYIGDFCGEYLGDEFFRVASKCLSYLYFCGKNATKNMIILLCVCFAAEPQTCVLCGKAACTRAVAAQLHNKCNLI